MKWGHVVQIKKKTIFYAATILACGNIVLQALGFIYRILLSHFAGAEGLGVYRLVNSAYLVINAGCLSGVTMACSRLSAASAAKNERRKIGSILRLSFYSFFTFCVICAGIILLFGNTIAARWLGDARCAKAFPFVVLCLALTGVENIFKALFIGLEQMQFTAYSEVGEQLIRICSVGVLLYHYQGNDYGIIAMLIFAGMVVSEIFSALFLTKLFQKNSTDAYRNAKLDAATAKQFFYIAFPLSAAALFSNIIGSAGSVLLPQRLMVAGLTYEQALSALGVVSGMAMPLLMLPIALVSSVCTALLPAVTSAQAVGNAHRVRALIGRSISTVGLIGLPATAVLIPIAPHLSELFFHQTLTTEYVTLLGMVAVVSYYQMSSGGLLNALGLQHLNVITAVSAELIQIYLMYHWCARPTLGIYGYLISVLLTDIGAFFINFLILYYNTRFSIRPLRRFGVPLLCGATLFYWTKLFFNASCMYMKNDLLALCITVIGAGLLYVFVLRLLGIRLLRYLSHRIVMLPIPNAHMW